MRPLLILLALLLVGCQAEVDERAITACAGQHGTAVMENGHYVRGQFQEGAK